MGKFGKSNTSGFSGLIWAVVIVAIVFAIFLAISTGAVLPDSAVNDGIASAVDSASGKFGVVLIIGIIAAVLGLLVRSRH